MRQKGLLKFATETPLHVTVVLVVLSMPASPVLPSTSCSVIINKVYLGPTLYHGGQVCTDQGAACRIYLYEFLMIKAVDDV